MYHLAPNAFRDSIEESGLIEGDAVGIWLWSDREWASDRSSFVDLWEVDVDGLEVYPGHEGSMEWGEDDPVFVVYQPIPPSRIKRVPTRYDSREAGSQGIWYHASQSQSFPTQGWVHVGNEVAARGRHWERGDRFYLHEVRFVGRAFNSPQTPVSDWEANQATEPTADLWMDKPDVLPESFDGVIEAADHMLGIYYVNESLAEDTGSVSLVASASSFVSVGVMDLMT